MKGWEERRLVYVALMIACSVLGAAAGPIAGFWSFFQVAALIELTCWIGSNRSHNWRHRAQRKG
ncbi:MAG: hypothetical protein ACI9JM_001502 [Halioglobus sp.]|jgi:hypothetical protein